MRNPARGSQALIRALAGVVVTALPQRVALNRGNLRGLNTNLPRRSARGDRNNTRRLHHLGVEQGPLQRARPTHRTTDDGLDFRNAYAIEKTLFVLVLVEDRHRRKARAIRITGKITAMSV